MLIEKEVIIKDKKGILSYDDTMFGKDANTLNDESYKDAKICFPDEQVDVTLVIENKEYNGYDDYYYKFKDVPDFYFRILDMDWFDEVLGYSEAIFTLIADEEELISILTKKSYFIKNRFEFKDCPKGYCAGNCSHDTYLNCEYSTLSKYGLCGEVCQDCGGDIHAIEDDEAYICDCNKILFKDRHKIM